MASDWTPPFTLAERLKYALIPPRLYIWRLVRKNLRKGEPELHLLPRLVPREKIAIDIGANKGVYTHVLAGLCAGVEAFEPNPKIHRILVRALPRNARAHNIALADRAGEAELRVPLYSGGYSNQHASLVTRAGKFGAVHVQMRTLDSYDFRNVGFIKIDVEGAEDKVLAGARATIARERPVLLVEMEERHRGIPLMQAIGQATALGYNAYYLCEGGLRPVAHLDAAANPPDGPKYVNNFIFLPAGSGGAFLRP
jgi:FkbM family methyltransferase